MLMDVKSKSKVFGIGLSRTGTKTLTAALDILGLTIVHYPNDKTTLAELEAGNCDFTILQYVNGITDITVVPFYEKLDILFPGSKFILTIREKASWLASVKEHWDYDLRTQGNAARNNDYATNYAVTQLLKQMVFGRLDFDAAHMAGVYDRYLQQVTTYFQHRPEDLLIIDICGRQGWEMLCPFLGCAVPDRLFPYIETDAQLQQQTLNPCSFLGYGAESLAAVGSLDASLGVALS